MGPVWLYNLSPSLAGGDHSNGEIYDDHDESEDLESGDDDPDEWLKMVRMRRT